MTEHTHDFSDWPFADAVQTVSFCTADVAQRRLPALRVSHDLEGDWQFLDATTEDPGEPTLLCLGCVFESDRTLAEVSDLLPGWSAYREHLGAPWERWQQEPECQQEDASEQKAHDDIATFGLHIISVTEEGDLPPFAYSIGIEKSLGLPELIVIGLNPSVAGNVLNACYDLMKDGTVFVPGTLIDGLLEGEFTCIVGAVDPEHLRPYMGWAVWFHQGTQFRALQIIYPSTLNIFPWEAEASDWFRGRQPLLSAAFRPSEPIDKG